MQTFINKIKKALDIPFVPPSTTPFNEYNEVWLAAACPKCGERNVDQLDLNDEDFYPETRVFCLTCDHVYTL